MIDVKHVVAFCGACIAFYIGSGFATLQEVLQYEASYGSMFWLVILVTAVIYVYTNLSFVRNGKQSRLVRGGDIYKVYCGKRIGAFYDYFSAFFCYLSFIVMIGGANSTVLQQWGLPNGVGAVILALLALVTVLAGLNGVLKTLSYLGPVIIVCLLGIALLSSFNTTLGLDAGLAAVDSGKYEIVQIGGGSPFASGFSYGGFVILWFAAFLGEIGAKNRLKEVNAGMLLSGLFIFGAATLCCIALISNVDVIFDASIPVLVLASKINPLLGQIFAGIIFLGIFTSAVPLLWTWVRKIANEGTRRYGVVTILSIAVACVIACFIPYKPLLNVIYGLNGYLGFILLIFMIIHDVRYLFKKIGTRSNNGALLSKHILPEGWSMGISAADLESCKMARASVMKAKQGCFKTNDIAVFVGQFEKAKSIYGKSGWVNFTAWAKKELHEGLETRKGGFSVSIASVGALLALLSILASIGINGSCLALVAIIYLLACIVILGICNYKDNIFTLEETKKLYKWFDEEEQEARDCIFLLGSNEED